MALSVPEDLTAALQILAGQRGVSVEEMLREVIVSYFRLEESFRDERAIWEAIRAEALEAVEKSAE